MTAGELTTEQKVAVVLAGQVVRREARKARQATAARDGAIVEARRLGLSFRAIAEHAGLSHTAVAKIIARHELEP